MVIPSLSRARKYLEPFFEDLVSPITAAEYTTITKIKNVSTGRLYLDSFIEEGLLTKSLQLVTKSEHGPYHMYLYRPSFNIDFIGELKTYWTKQIVKNDVFESYHKKFPGSEFNFTGDLPELVFTKFSPLDIILPSELDMLSNKVYDDRLNRYIYFHPSTIETGKTWQIDVISP